MSDAYNTLADFQKDKLKDYESAEKNYCNAVEINKRIVDQSYTYEHRYGYYNLALFQGATLNDKDAAEHSFTRTISIMEALKVFLCEAVGSPGLPKYWSLLDSAKQNLSALKS